MHKRYPAIGRPEHLSSDLMEVCCSQYLRTGETAVDQVFYDATEEPCTIWMAELASNATSYRRGQPSPARTDHETTGRVTRERTSDDEPVDMVPFPNSSRIIRERSVQFLKANET